MATLIDTDDAQEWAAEFFRIFKGKEVGGEVLDEGMLIAWFANAIETGKRIGVARHNIVATSDEDGHLRLPREMLDSVLFSSELLQVMVDKFNAIIDENAGDGILRDSFVEGATDARRQHPQ